MDNLSNTRIVRLFQSFSKIIGVIVALIGAIALIGWLFDIPTLKSVHPSLVAMKANTALNFVLIGISLLLLQKSNLKSRWKYRLARLFSVVIALIGLISLCEYIAGYNLGIDQLLFKESLGAVATSNLGRMAPNTAVNFILIGVALMLIDVKTKQGYVPAQIFIIFEGIISLLAVVGYAYGARQFCGIAPYTIMAVNTSVAFMLIFFGILFILPDRGFMMLFTKDIAAGVICITRGELIIDLRM